MMMLKKIFKFASLGIIFLALSSSYSPFAHAKPGTGITIEPAFATISLAPTDISKSATVSVINNNSYSVLLNTSIHEVDVNSGILAPTKAIDTAQDSTVKLDKTDFQLAPGESMPISVTVSNTPSLAPGGTYRAMVIRQVSKPGANVGMQSAISASIFITKQQGAVRSLDLNNIKIKQSLWQEPSSVLMSFKNTGNTHVVPRGVVAVTSADKSVFYKKGVINQESITIFPGKNITTETVLTIVEKSWLPAKQKVVVQYRFDDLDNIQTAEKTILYVPWVYYLLPILLVAAVVFITKFVKKRRRSKHIKTQANTAATKNKTQIKVRDDYEGVKITVHRK